MVEIFLRYMSERVWECIWGFLGMYLGEVLSIVGIVDVLWVFRLIMGISFNCGGIMGIVGFVMLWGF